MMTVYTTRIYRVLLNLLYASAATVTVFFVANWFTGSLLLPMVIGAAVFLLYVWLVIWDSRVTITVDDQHLTVTKGNNVKRFSLKDHGFRAKTLSSSGDTECHLYITDAEGREEHVDCELIGIGQFRQLLDDLGITGSKAQATKIKTIKE